MKPMFDCEPKPANGVLGCWPRLNRHQSLLASLTALTRMLRWHGSRDVTSKSRSPLTLRIVEGVV